jgi:predicted phosphoribosyltransferase
VRAYVVLAIPVAPEDSVAPMRAEADEVIVLETPPWFLAIGEAYEDFGQTSDEEVVALLEQAAAAGSGLAAELPGRV